MRGLITAGSACWARSPISRSNIGAGTFLERAPADASNHGAWWESARFAAAAFPGRTRVVTAKPAVDARGQTPPLLPEV